MSLSVSGSAHPQPRSAGWLPWRGNASESAVDFTKNDLLLGSRDPIFWFLVPLFGLISAGLCVVINYTALGATRILCIPFDLLSARPAWVKHEDGRSVDTRTWLCACTDPTMQEVYGAWFCHQLAKKTNYNHQRITILGIHFHSLSICVSRRLHCTASNLHAGVTVS